MSLLRLIQLALAGFLLALGSAALAQTSAQTPTAAVKKLDPRALIGLSDSSKYETYPDGWKSVLADGYGGLDGLGLSGLENKSTKQYALLLIKTKDEGLLTKTRFTTVVDALEIKENPNNYFRFARLCYRGDVRPKPLPEAILAEVRFNKRCALKTTRIQRAWQIDFKNNKFVPIAQTQGLTCEFGFISSGEPDDRRGCPTFNYVQ